MRDDALTYHLILPDEPEPVPITNLFGPDGDEVTTFEEADSFVAGPLANGQWLSAPAEDYRVAVAH